MEVKVSTPCDRRQFLRGAAAALLAAHSDLTRAASGSSSMTEAPKKSDGPRIVGLRLSCSVPLAEMRAFYSEKLGLAVLAEDAQSLTVAGGSTRLTFVVSAPEEGEPFYHFAFNIPENKILLAREWQLKRTPLIPPGSNLQDPSLPTDVVDYSHWNAHSVFFWDPAGNLVEYIARHDLGNSAPGPFSSEDILYASEIGLIVDDVDTLAAELKETFKLEQYRGGSEAFRAIGDERGLLLAMQRGRNLGFGQGKPAGIFSTDAEIHGVAESTYLPKGLPYRIVSKI